MSALRYRLRSLPRFYARRYNSNNIETTPHTPRSPQCPPPSRLQARHEAQEGTTALNLPLNPPGGGPGGGGPGGGTFTFTNSPILDAMLTTAIGLGAGKRICPTYLTILSAQYGVPSLHWRRCIRQMVQDKRLEQSTSPLTFSTSTPDAFVPRQMEKAFAAGYDPALELTKVHMPTEIDSNGRVIDDTCSDHGPWTEYLRRKEQDAVDRIVHGRELGHYFMLLGPKVSAQFFLSSCLQY